MAGERYLVISDLQIPFEARGALGFCKAVQKEFKIPKENILNVGDETDQYHGSRFPKSPDALITAKQELSRTRERMKDWGEAFPLMRLATSNHGQRWFRKAAAADIPSEILKCYRDVIAAPEGWQWRDAWDIKTKVPFRIFHGVGYGGQYAYRTAAMDLGINVAFGHLHSHAGIARIKTATQNVWGMNTGCLIDAPAFAFEYGRDFRFKPCIGLGVVIDDGRTPILLPFERGFK